MITPEEVIRFWFKESSEKDWFSRNDAFDAKIRERFLDTYLEVAKGESKSWRGTPEGRLAEIIVLDQFARNLFRDDAQAFAEDNLALTLAREAVRVSADKELPSRMRHFLYMPYMHSESLEAHDEGRKLFESLGNDEVLKYEDEHRKILETFDRYPHRNKVLGRASTSEEEEFLKSHKGF